MNCGGGHNAFRHNSRTATKTNAMERITYTAPNLMDWVAQIKAGAATVKVHFSGGSLTAYGVTPAEYTTDSKFIQQVIERSTYFKEGRINIGRRVEIPDPVKPMLKAQKPVAAPAPITESAAADKPAAAKEAGLILIPTAQAEGTDSASEGTESAETTRTTVEVSCLQDAQDYLQQNFGISSYKVRSKPSAQKAAMEHGVMFVGGGFDTDWDKTAETEANE